MQTVTIGEALAQGKLALAQVGQRNASFDTHILLGHVLDVERSTLYTYPERALATEQAQQFFSLLARRLQGEPVAYLIGHKAFYGRDFFVDQRVLIPRPETELLVEKALASLQERLAHGEHPIVADIGTGSGIIPITLALEEPRLPYLYACDISPTALEVTQLNCQRHHIAQRIHLQQGNLLAALPEPVDMLTANLPYVGTDEMQEIQPDVHAYEPHLALFSGPQGLDLLLHFCQDIKLAGKLKAHGSILLEIGYQQSTILSRLLAQLWPQATITCTKDYAGWERLLEVNT